MSKPLVHIYTDGGCSPNPGAGGWGAVLISPERRGYRKEISGADPETTNNRMELTAAIQAFRALKVECQVVMHTDSRYLRDAFENGWIAKWQRKGWERRRGQPVLNQDLWQELIELSNKHEVTWKWVRGHAGNKENNRCDQLATNAMQKYTRPHRRREWCGR